MLVDIEVLTAEEFAKLDLKLKELKVKGELPAVQRTPLGTDYITVEGRCYPLEAMFNRESLVKAARIKLMRGRLLIKAAEEPRLSSTGLVVILKSADSPKRGRVIKVGPDKKIKKKTVTSPCEVGDLIVYVSGAHLDVKVDGHKFTIISFGDVLAKLRD